jgi:hypothetical protein
MAKNPPVKLLIAIDPDNPKVGKAISWKWYVGERRKAPLATGTTVGARSKARIEAETARRRLKRERGAE